MAEQAQKSEFDVFETGLDEQNKLQFAVFREHLRKKTKELDDKKGNKNNPLRKISQKQLIVMWKKFRRAGINIDGENALIDSRGAPSLTAKGCKKMVFTIYPQARVEYQVVYKGNKFSVSRTDEGVRYNLEDDDPFADHSEKNIAGAFCHIVTNDGTGTEVFEIMNKVQIDECRKTSMSKATWEHFYEEMAKKTVLKRATKSLRYDSRVKDVLDLDNEVNGNDFKHPEEPKQIEDDDVLDILNKVEVKDEDESC